MKAPKEITDVIKAAAKKKINSRKMSYDDAYEQLASSGQPVHYGYLDILLYGNMPSTLTH